MKRNTPKTDEKLRREQEAVLRSARPSRLTKTKGCWKAGDGLEYQRRLREEWR